MGSSVRRLLAVALIAGCTANLEPIFGRDAGGGTGGGTGGGLPEDSPVVVVEPFDYHYPDEVDFEAIDDRITLQATLGERESASVVYRAERDVDQLVARATVLRSEQGIELPAAAISVEVVMFQPRDGEGLLPIAWEGGVQAGDMTGDERGLHQDAKAHQPVVPCALVSDAVLYETAVASGEQLIALPAAAMAGVARTPVAAGQGRQLWVTVHVPADLQLPQARTRFDGTIELDVDGETIPIPVELDVLALTLDSLAQHGRHVGGKRTTEDAPPEFESAIITDLAQTGANAFRGQLDVPTDYETLTAVGVDVALNLNPMTSAEAATVRSLGFEPYIYDDNMTVAMSADALNAAHDVDALYAGAEDFEFLTELIATAGVPDYWAHGITNPERDSDPVFTDLLNYLDDIAADPSQRIASVESHSEDSLPAHAPLRTRLMTGFWLYGSGLDGAVLWGYSLLGDANPHLDAAYVGVVLPVLRDGTEPALLGTYTRAAFREGIDDLRYALTVDRMIDEAGRADLRIAFDDELRRYLRLFAGGDRVDYRNREADVRRTRQRLFEWAAELIEAD